MHQVKSVQQNICDFFAKIGIQCLISKCHKKHILYSCQTPKLNSSFSSLNFAFFPDIKTCSSQHNRII